MSRTSFENFGRRTLEVNDPTQMAARYRIQKDAERRIVLEIARKLNLLPEDVVLEVGCNVGTLLIPISFLCKEVSGIDHAYCVERLSQRYQADNVHLIAGNFLEVEVAQQFDKILCYSVIQYLKDSEEVLRFVDKLVHLLRPGGKMLLGDIPNISLKNRFLQSDSGREFVQRWEALRNRDAQKDLAYDHTLPQDTELVQFDDALVLRMVARCRAQGFHAYTLPQAPDLPFGNTREDILISRLE